MKIKFQLKILAVFFIINVILNSVAVSGDTSSEEDVKKKNSSHEQDDSSSESREKRSQEEIMFGNQQNKPNGLMDNLMEIAENMESQLSKESNQENSTTDTQDKGEDKKKIENTSKEDDDDSKEEEIKSRQIAQEASNTNDNTNTDGSEDGANWYSSAPVSTDTLQYLLNSPSLRPIPASGELGNHYDQDDLYRKRRQVVERSLPLRKRSLRSPLGQMIETRGRRLPRRSMRLKRQVDVDLLNFLGNLDYNNKASRFYEDEVPEGYNTLPYQETLESKYPYPYSFANGDDNPSSDNEEEDTDSIYAPQGIRYVDNPTYTLPYRPRESQNEDNRDWMERAPQPTIFTVNRRSAPVFYPIDYRYVPFRKRSRFSGANRMDNGIRIGEDEEKEKEFGKWGRIVQVPEAYASAEDVARLYALANLMAESEPDAIARRSV